MNIEAEKMKQPAPLRAVFLGSQPPISEQDNNKALRLAL